MLLLLAEKFWNFCKLVFKKEILGLWFRGCFSCSLLLFMFQLFETGILCVAHCLVFSEIDIPCRFFLVQGLLWMHKMILEFSVTDEVEVLKFSDFSLSVSGFLNCIENWTGMFLEGMALPCWAFLFGQFWLLLIFARNSSLLDVRLILRSYLFICCSRGFYF